jgi:signal-transduction protein with cAMP-binding, CBS, and nucleotidyltransferase domain
MKVTEVMHTPAVTCRPEDHVGDVARAMRDRQVGSVVVIDRVGEVAGIVTDRDLALRCVADGRSADIEVAEVMSRDVATVDPHADIESAAKTMLQRGVRRLPVVDEFGSAHGLVALDDLVRLTARQAGELGDLLRDQVTSVHSAV